MPEDPHRRTAAVLITDQLEQMSGRIVYRGILTGEREGMTSEGLTKAKNVVEHGLLQRKVENWDTPQFGAGRLNFYVPQTLDRVVTVRVSTAPKVGMI